MEQLWGICGYLLISCIYCDTTFIYAVTDSSRKINHHIASRKKIVTERGPQAVRNKMVPNKQLKHARELCGWSRSYIAERLESDPKTVARWERGDTFPSPFFRQKLCELFRKDAEELGLIKDDQHNGQY